MYCSTFSHFSAATRTNCVTYSMHSSSFFSVNSLHFFEHQIIDYCDIVVGMAMWAGETRNVAEKKAVHLEKQQVKQHRCKKLRSTDSSCSS